MSRKLTCSRGHEWSLSSGAVAVETVCPVCGASPEFHTLDGPSHDEQVSTDNLNTVVGQETRRNTAIPKPSMSNDPTVGPSQSLSALSKELPLDQTMELPSKSTDVQPALGQTMQTLGDDPKSEDRTEPAATAPGTIAPDTGEPIHVVSKHVEVPGYEIIKELGRGGMGVVYKARQIRANRVVALKMILGGGHASHRQLERFRIEGEAVARLQHPNIVQVFEVAEHDGMPYFSLEYLGGGSLLDYLDGTPWPAERAAEMVETLARAMQHAHEKKIVHRDLKPANVLLARGVYRSANTKSILPAIAGAAKITDFGLAKEMESQTGQTQSGDVIGTPSYMAPEQAKGHISQIGPCTDIYSLGAILYELLTGRPPFKGTTLVDTLEQVRIQEPVPPRQLQLHSPRDLETICLKCLHKEPNRRYETALELAEDLRRFRAGEPIKARPVSRTERVYRWCRRNPKDASLLTALVLVILIGLVSVSLLWRQAESNWERAEQQRGRAEFNLREALGAVDTYFTNVSENRLLNEPGADTLRRDLLVAARDYYEKFVRENRDAPELKAELGKSLYRLGLIFAELDSDGPGKGIEYLNNAHAVFVKLVQDDPKVTAHRCDLANTAHHLGRLHRLRSDTAASQKFYEEALKLWEELAREEAKDNRYRAGLARTQLGLGNLALVRGKYKDAETAYGKSLAMRQELVKQDGRNDEYKRDLAVSHDNLTNVYYQSGQLAKADQATRAAEAILKKLVAANPKITLYRDDLARHYFIAGERLALQGDTDKAKQAYAEALRIWQKLSDEHPVVPQFRSGLASVYHNQSELARRQQDYGEAEKLAAQSLKIKEQLAELNPDAPHYTFQLALAHTQAGHQQREQKQFDRARDGYRKALEVLEKLVKDYPEVLAYQTERVTVCNQLGLVALEKKDEAEAERCYREGLKIADDLIRSGRKSPELQLASALCRRNLADLAFADGSLGVARSGYQTVREVLEGLLRDQFRKPDVEGHLARVLWAEARTFEEGGNSDKAAPVWKRALELSDETLKKEIILNRSLYRSRQATAWMNEGKHAEAARAWAVLIEGERAHEKMFTAAESRKRLLFGHEKRAWALTNAGEFADALKDWDAVLALAEEKQRNRHRVSRLHTLARSGEHIQATREAEALLANLGTTGSGAFDVAVVHAVAAAVASQDTKLTESERKRLAEQYALRVLALLQDAEKQGWFKQPANVKRLSQDKVFDGLRERDDVKAFLKRLAT